MATTADLINLKHDYQAITNAEKLKSLFSPAILGWARKNNLNTFEDMANFAGSMDLHGRHLKTLQGIDLLTALTNLDLRANQLTDIGDISGLTALTYLSLRANQLTDIGDLSGLTALTYLNINSTQLTDIGDLSGLTAIITLQLGSAKLTDIGDLSGLTALTYLNIYNNNFTTAKVDGVLSAMHTAYDATGKIATIDLSGANMGIPTDGTSNADYVYLTNAGVSVTIRTA